MKNNLLLSFLLMGTGTLSPLAAQEAVQTLTWRGYDITTDETAAPNAVWNNTIANWLDLVEFADLGFEIPYAFSDGVNASFDDGVNEGYENVSLKETVKVNNVVFDNTAKNYSISGGGKIEGTGVLLKKGAGSVKLGITNSLSTTIVEGGVLEQASYDAAVFGDSLVIAGATIKMGDSNSSSKYTTWNHPVYVGEGVSTIEFGRYSYMLSKIYGTGDLHLGASGERCYLGNKSVSTDFSEFTGKVYIEKADRGTKPGSFGLVLKATQTFKYDTLTQDINVPMAELADQMNTNFAHLKVHVADGAVIYSESGDRAYRIGELNTDEGATIYNYYKASNPNIYYVVGGLNTDAVIGAQFTQADKNGNPYTGGGKLGLVKEGTGTYRLTNGESNFNGGIHIREGKVFVSNATGTRGITGAHNGGTAVYVYPNGVLGGTGRIAGGIEVYENGTIAPGENGIGTLTIAGTLDTATGEETGTQKGYVTLRKNAVVEFDLASPTNHDKLIMNAALTLEDGSKIVLKKAAGATLQAGDEFVIIEALSKDEASVINLVSEIPNISFREESETEKVEAEDGVVTETPKSYKLIATVTTTDGLGNVSAQSLNQVYPTLATDNITVSGNVDRIDILSLSGNIVKTTAASVISVADLQNGIYMVRIQNGTSVTVKQIIKQ